MQFNLRELGDLLGKDYNYVITNCRRGNLKKVGTGKSAFVDLNDSFNMDWLLPKFTDLKKRLEIDGINAPNSLFENKNDELPTKNESTDPNNLQIDKVTKTISQSQREYEQYRAKVTKENYIEKRLKNEVANGKLIEISQVIVIIEAYIDQYKRSNKTEMIHLIKSICLEVGADDDKADFMDRAGVVLDSAADTARVNTMKALLGDKFEEV